MKKITLLITTVIILSITTQAQIVSTIAGNGTLVYAGDNTPATASGLTVSPSRATIDRHGNVYFADEHRVRKVNTAGIITTIAGTGTAGYSGDSGPATAAMLNGPEGLAVDTADNLYIADRNNSRIRKVDATGKITTYVGGSSTPVPNDGDGGPATAALFIAPNNLLTDKAGNLYLSSNLRIRKVNAAGIITAFAGDYSLTHTYMGDGLPATATGLGMVNQMALNAAGDMYCVVDNWYVYKITTTGLIYQILYPHGIGDGGDGGPATAAAYNNPAGICLDAADNIYLSFMYGGRIRRIDAVTGIVNRYAGTTEGYSGDGGPAIAAQFGTSAYSIVMDCADNMYIPDDYRIRKITKIHTPQYANESSMLQVCENSTANPVGTPLQAKSDGTGEALPWSIVAPPMHGTIGGAPYTTTVASGTMTPGLTYTPAPGYIGTDSFRVMVGECEQVSDMRTIYVTVNPLPVVAAITGSTGNVCKDKTITLSSTTAGGTWSASSTSVSVAGGVVTGITAGTTTVSYTVTALSCSNSATYAVKVNNCPAGVTQVTAGANLSVYPNPVSDVVRIDGLIGNIAYKLMNMMGSVIMEGTVNDMHNEVNVKDLAGGVYMISVSQGAEKAVYRVMKR